MSDKRFDPLYDEYGAPEKPIRRVMISVSGLWRWFKKNRKKKKKPVRRY
jgi:hypothetical protein